VRTVIKVAFLALICIVAVEVQAYATTLSASQATSVSLNQLNSRAGDHGSWATSMTRFWADNAAMAVMWLGISTFTVMMFRSELTHITKLVLQDKE
jgi:hypothetical protein